MLIPEQKKPTFTEFASGWWDLETCRYLKWRQLHDPIKDNTLIRHQSNFKLHIADYFANFQLDEITPVDIENWLLFMREKGSLKDVVKKPRGKKKLIDDNVKKEIDAKPKKLLKPVTINLALGTLKIMLGEAVKLKLMKTNPCNEIKDLKMDKPEMIILTVEEAIKMIPADWSTVWDNNIVYKAHTLAACTGLRIGELRGLRGEFVFDKCIYIKGQYTRFGYVDYTKTKHNRTIPIPPVMRGLLDDLLAVNGSGFVFSEDGGKKPITTDLINRGYNRALKKIGISYQEKLKRNLSFHSWRHFLNTLLLTSNIGLSKVQAVTGHLSNGTTDHYTHFDTSKFTEVMDVQTNLLTHELPKNTQTVEMKAVSISNEQKLISHKTDTDTTVTE